MGASRREHLVDTALDLFRRNGFHATGIDKILAEAGCAKMTLYNHFKSKDELILAALRRRDELYRNQYMRSVERRAKEPRARLIALFDALEEWFQDEHFAGCTFIKASCEYGRLEDPIHAAALEHKRMVHAYVRDLAAEAGASDPLALSQGLVLLMEGATVMAQIAGGGGYAKQAREAGEALIRDSLGS